MLHKNQSYAVYVTIRKNEVLSQVSTLIFDLITYKVKEKRIIKGE